jgi:hypothetical protein
MHRIAVDPDYYSADEAAYITGHILPSDKRDDNRRLFRGNALPFFLVAHSTQEGYIYASHKRPGVALLIFAYRGTCMLCACAFRCFCRPRPLTISQEPIPPHMAIDLGWNESADPAREERGESYMVPTLNVP